MALSIRNLTKRYKDITALDDFSVEITGGVLGLLGPNGAGKTTMMNIAASILRQNEGSVLWNGEDINKLGASYRSILGYLPQSPGLYKNFTAKQYLRYMAALKGVYQTHGENCALEKHIETILEQVNLNADANRRIGTFSGGMRQRVGIAQALLGDPKLLIFDEPTSGLDPQERIRLRNLVSIIALDKIVIWATHIVSDIESIAREVILLKKGKRIVAGSPSALAANMEGKIWTLKVHPNDVLTYQEHYKIGNVLQQEDGRVLLRLIHPEKPHETALAAEPCLEDLYLFHFEGESTNATTAFGL